MEENDHEKKQYRGILICPARHGLVEFRFTAGDRIVDLEMKIKDIWGKTSAIVDEKSVYSLGGWMIFGQTADGSYVRLKSNYPIPTKPLGLQEDEWSQYVSQFPREPLTIKHSSIMVETVTQRYRLNLDYPELNEVPETCDICLVALIAFDGG